MVREGIQVIVRRLIFRTSASRDLRAIAASTRKRWGSEQAASYVAEIRRQIKSLRDVSERFPEAEEGYHGLRKMRSGHHVVFYLVDKEVIEVVRVLHERMNLGAQFD